METTNHKRNMGSREHSILMLVSKISIAIEHNPLSIKNMIRISLSIIKTFSCSKAMYLYAVEFASTLLRVTMHKHTHYDKYETETIGRCKRTKPF